MKQSITSLEENKLLFQLKHDFYFYFFMYKLYKLISEVLFWSKV